MITRFRSIPPSERPAAELPEYEPTEIELMAIKLLDHDAVEALIESALLETAVAATLADLDRLRADLSPSALMDDATERLVDEPLEWRWAA